MKRVSVLLLLFAGCGSEFGDPAATRPTLAEARELCLPFDNTGTGFDLLVSLTRALRNDGLTETEAIFGFGQTCNLEPETFDECAICTTAITAALWR